MTEIQLYNRFYSLYGETYYSGNDKDEYHNIKEYIQLKILEYIATTEYSNKFILVGGTAIRLFYGSNRLSNDLDFNTISINKEEFEKVCDKIKNYLVSCGYIVNMTYYKTNYLHCKLSIYSGILKEGFPYLQETDINIKMKFDAVDDKWEYPIDYFIPLKTISNTPILTTYGEVLLSKKIISFLSRTHNFSHTKDLYDILFLYERFEPYFPILEECEYISSHSQVFERIFNRIKTHEDNIIDSIHQLNTVLKNEEINSLDFFIEKLKLLHRKYC